MRILAGLVISAMLTTFVAQVMYIFTLGVPPILSYFRIRLDIDFSIVYLIYVALLQFIPYQIMRRG